MNDLDINPEIRAFWENRGYIIENDITLSVPIYWKFWVIYPDDDGDDGVNYRPIYIASIVLYNGSIPPTERDEKEIAAGPDLDTLTYYTGELGVSYNEEEMLQLIKLPVFW